MAPFLYISSHWQCDEDAQHTSLSVLCIHLPPSLAMKLRSSSLFSYSPGHPNRLPIKRMNIMVLCDLWTPGWRYPKWAFGRAYNLFLPCNIGRFFIFFMEDGETLMLVIVRLLALQGQGSGLLHGRQGGWSMMTGSPLLLTIPSELVNVCFKSLDSLSLSLSLSHQPSFSHAFVVILFP